LDIPAELSPARAERLITHVSPAAAADEPVAVLVAGVVGAGEGELAVQPAASSSRPQPSSASGASSA
jgi:hypothetical protein